jgi:hypothetical protein
LDLTDVDDDPALGLLHLHQHAELGRLVRLSAAQDLSVGLEDADSDHSIEERAQGRAVDCLL